MADSAGKVAKLVQQKLEDYFNRQRVETEFDPSGKRIHTTPLVVHLELSYLQAAEQQWKTNTKKKKKKKKKKDAKQMTQEEGQDSDEAKNKESVNRGGDSGAEVSPRVTTNSKIKSRIKGSEIDRITKNAQNTLGQVSINKIHKVHRYRPDLIPKEYLDLGKVARVSCHIDAILNTEHAWDCAEEYDDREAAKIYVEEKNKSERKDQDGLDESQNATASTEKKIPMWLRVELERAQQKSQSDLKKPPANQTSREDGGEKDSSVDCHEMRRQDGQNEDIVDDSENTDRVLVEGTENEEKREDGEKEGTNKDVDDVRDDGWRDGQNADKGNDSQIDQGSDGVRNDSSSENEKVIKGGDGNQKSDSVLLNDPKDVESKTTSYDGKLECAEAKTKSGQDRSADCKQSDVLSEQWGRDGKDRKQGNGDIKNRDSKSKQNEGRKTEKHDCKKPGSEKWDDGEDMSGGGQDVGTRGEVKVECGDEVGRRGDVRCEEVSSEAGTYGGEREKISSVQDVVTRGGESKDEYGEGVGSGDEVGCGEVSGEPGTSRMKKVDEDKRGEESPKPAGSAGEGEVDRIEEYVRTESMVLVTSV